MPRLITIEQRETKRRYRLVAASIALGSALVSGCSGDSGAAPSLPSGVSVVGKVSGADAAQLVFLSFLANLKTLDGDAALDFLCEPDQHRDAVEAAVGLLGDLSIDERYRGEVGTGSVVELGDGRFEVTDELTVAGTSTTVKGVVESTPAPCLGALAVSPPLKDPLVPEFGIG